MFTDNTVTLAADVRGQFQAGVDSLFGWLNENAGLVRFMRVVGALMIVAIIALWLLKKYKPNSQLGTVLNMTGAGWIAGLALSIILVVPDLAAALLGTTGGWLLNLLYTVWNGIFG